ncbi:COX6C oxidase, partial [Crocuta crocuta]
VSRGGSEREGDTDSESGSRLRAGISTEPDVGLKPMNRFLAKHLRFHIVGAFSVSPGVASFCMFAVATPSKKEYADFYRNYDSTKDFVEMKEGGIFQSAK